MEEIRSFVVNGITYFGLYIKCPVCLEHDVENNPHRKWEHAHKENGEPCGGSMFIGDNGNLYCEECKYTSPLVCWKYHCINHESLGLGKYVSITNVRVISEVLSVAGQLVKRAGQDWFMKTIIEVDKQFKNTNFQQTNITK